MNKRSPSKRASTRTTGADPLQTYLNEISKIPLLTVAEEKDLGVRAQAGEVLAIQTLVASNLRFVVKVAKRYRSYGVSFLDLINEGNLGLMQAARRFDPERNIRFISYAVWWIRQSILGLLADMGHAFRLPLKINNMLYKVRCASVRLTSDSSEKPTLEEIAGQTGMQVPELTGILKIGGGQLSLDHSASEDHQTLYDTLANTRTNEGHEWLMERAMNDGLHSVLSDLKDKEREILILRFGLNNQKCHTLKQIGERIGVSRERVRQIQEHALGKLRKNSKARSLFGNLRGAA